MLDLGDINKKQRASNESFSAVVYSVLVAVIAILYVWAKIDDYQRNKKRQQSEQEKQQLDKYTQILIKNYGTICQYINTELKDDPFFFKDVSFKVHIDKAIICVTDRMRIAKKLIGLPIPSSSDTTESYTAKLSSFVRKNNLVLKYEDIWEDGCRVKGSYASNKWLDANLVKILLKYSAACEALDNAATSRLDKIISMSLRSSDGSSKTIDEIFEDEIDSRVYAGEARDDTSDTWEKCAGYEIRSEMKNLTKHLLSYFKAKYGSEMIAKAKQKLTITR